MIGSLLLTVIRYGRPYRCALIGFVHDIASMSRTTMPFNDTGFEADYRYTMPFQQGGWYES